MHIDSSFWEYDDGHWKLPSLLARALCSSAREGVLSNAELYYILDALGAKERFADFWERPDFYLDAGMSTIALKKALSSPSHGRSNNRGELAWAMGDEVLAEQYFKEEMLKRRDRGFDGLFRLRFSQGKFTDCIAIFNDTCPPEQVSFSDVLNGRCSPKKSKNKCGYSSSDFISTGPVMLRIIVYAAVHSHSINNKELLEKIARYFDVSPQIITDLASTFEDNTNEYPRLKRRILPRGETSSISELDLLKKGQTTRAAQYVKSLLNYEAIISDITKQLEQYLSTGTYAVLDELTSTPVFNITDIDAVIFDVALENIVDKAAEQPERQLFLLRTFSLFTRYPSTGYSLKERWGWHRHLLSYFSEFSKCVHALQIVPKPIDLIIGMRKINWYDQNQNFNSRLIHEHMEWSMALLSAFIEKNYSEGIYSTEQTTVTFLQNAYRYLEEKYAEAQSQQRWKSEEMLTQAIMSLFGERNVQQHAHPIWLTPQHLDIYLPKHNLAIEYMGKQHYEPVEYFGGQEAFEATVERDKRKKDLCARMNVALIYVTHEEDIGKRAKEIHAQYAQSYPFSGQEKDATNP